MAIFEVTLDFPGLLADGRAPEKEAIQFVPNRLLPVAGATLLPVMSLPHQHTNWFVTGVGNTEVSAADLRIPGKGKKISNAELQAMLKDRMKDWGKFAQRSMEAVML